MELSQKGPLRDTKDLLETETNNREVLGRERSTKSEKNELTMCQGVLCQEGKEKTDEGVDKLENKEKMNEGEEETHLLYRRTHPIEMFQTMKDFRDAGLLTDFTLRTSDGGCFCTHFPIMAALSSVLHHQQQQGGKDSKLQQKSERYAIRKLSIFLDPEVESSGLAEVVEFAYTGTIMSLNSYTVAKIRAAAKALGVFRVLALCNKGEEKWKEEGRRLSSQGQLEVSFQDIRQLWTEQLGCDVELEAEGRHFYAHRVVLAASSDYFRGMFTSGMRESYQPTVTLQSVGSMELEALLNCSYTGSLPLSWGSVFQTTVTALQLQMQPALSLCFNFLHQRIDPNTCLDVASFAEAYEIADLQELAEDYVLRHFSEVAATPKFLDLPSDKLLEYLRSDSLCVPSELIVFRAVVSWIEADRTERMGFAQDLMKEVHFPLMTFREFHEVKAVDLWRACSDTLDLCWSSFSSLEEQYRVYYPKDKLVLVGGDQITADFNKRCPSRKLWFANTIRSRTGLVREIEWRILAEMPESSRFSHAVGVLEGNLYIIGGRHYYGTADTLNSAYRYNPLENTWKKLADMHEHRSNFSLAVRDKRLYAIGGDGDISNNLDSVECYCPESNCWRFSRPLDQALSGHAAAVWDGEIFISGGFDCRYQCLVSMFLYHPETGTTYLCDMSQDRALHCMEKLAGHFYVAGGVCNLRKFYTDQLLCERYDPLTDSWSSITSLSIPHASGASAVLEDKIYILGGYCQEDYSESGLVHRYDPATLRWENMGRMPGPNTYIRACILHFPAQL